MRATTSGTLAVANVKRYRAGWSVQVDRAGSIPS